MNLDQQVGLGASEFILFLGQLIQFLGTRMNFGELEGLFTLDGVLDPSGKIVRFLDTISC